MNWFSRIRFLVGLVPMLVEVVRTVEEALPQGGRGSEKLALVRGIIEDAFEIGNDVFDSFEDAWPTISKLVARIVAFFNDTGVFKKGE